MARMADAAPVTITVCRVSPVLAPQVRRLRAAPEQAPFVGDTAVNLQDAQNDPRSEAMAVLADGRAIGFYRLDFAPDAIAERVFDEASVGLRAFLIDAAHQDKGYGARAIEAMCADLRHRHLDRTLLALSVNCRNAAAIAVYTRAGFVESGPLYPYGGVGPQYVLVRRLRETSAVAERGPHEREPHA